MTLRSFSSAHAVPARSARPAGIRNPAFGLLLLVALLFAGCRKGETPVEVGNRTQVLQLGNLSEPSDLDPQIISSQQDFNIVLGLIEGLTSYHPVDCHPVPGVAERWESSEDGLTWTFHLRNNSRWSNGDPVTAHDFVWSYQRMLTPELGSEYAYMLFCLVNAEAFLKGEVTDFSQVGVKAPDDHTLVLSLAYPVPYLPGLVAHASWYPVHRATIEKHGTMGQRGTRWTRPENYVGNGPFTLAEWKQNQVIRLVKSATYWDADRILLSGVNVYPIESNSTEEAMFRSGQLHITSTIPPDKIPAYKNDPEIAHFLHQETQLATYFFRFNITRKPLDDVRVRRALSMAIDRQQMVERVTLGGQQPAYTLTPPDTAGYTAPSSIKDDPDEARRLLAEAGFPGGAGFPRLELLYNTNEGHRKIAEAVQQMWRTRLGIEISIRNVEARVWNDLMRQMDYEIGRYAWVGDYLDPSTFLELMTSTSGNNQTGWANPAYDALVDQARRTADQDQRYDLYRQAEKLLIDESPIAPLYFYTRNNLQRPEVKGWHGNLLDLHPFKGVHLEP